MYCRVIATDFDGTAATDGKLAPEARGVLAAAREQGVTIVLVTGRVLEDIEQACGDLSEFDVVIAENGAVLCLPAAYRTITLGPPPPADLLKALRDSQVPFHAGAVVVGTGDRHATRMLDLLRHHAPDHCLVFNRGALMALPSGINKASGVERALYEIGRSPHNMVAFGDAENDISLFRLAEIAVVAKGASARVAAHADASLGSSEGAGLAEYVRAMIDGGCLRSTPKRHFVEVGIDSQGHSVRIPASGANVLLSGDAHSGKSYVAGVVAEQLLDLGYRLCIVDPEGDHAAIGERPDTLVLGHNLALPPAADVPLLLRDQSLSLVLNLTSLKRRDAVHYVTDVLARLEEFRAVSGIPHWILVDEAHDFFAPAAEAVDRLGAATGNFLLVTYQPSRLDPVVLDRTGIYLVMKTVAEDERYFATSVIGARGPRDVIGFEALDALRDHRVGMLTMGGDGRGEWRVFVASRRRTVHTHHARKYSDTVLADDKAFRFIEPGGSTIAVAHNMAEFHSLLRTVSAGSLRRHLASGDFSKWVSGVLGDSKMAQCFALVEHSVAAGSPPPRDDLVREVEEHYGL